MSGEFMFSSVEGLELVGSSSNRAADTGHSFCQECLGAAPAVSVAANLPAMGKDTGLSV